LKINLLHIIGGLAMMTNAVIASADVSGNWIFSVTLGDLGSGDAVISMSEEADGSLSGTYSGQLANGPISGTYTGNDFEFSFNSSLIGADITYSGTVADDGTGSGLVQAQGADIGTFTARKTD